MMPRERLGRIMVWFVAGIDRLAMYCSERYKVGCLYRDYNRLRIPNDPEWNAHVMDVLMREYGYGELIGGGT